MRVIETKVYTYDELSDDAKAKARDWLREANAGDIDWAEFTTDDTVEALSALGFELDTPRGSRTGKALYWSLGCPQGDGASFAGVWRAENCKPEKLLADRPEVYATPNGENAKCAANVALHALAARVVAIRDAGANWARIDAGRSHFTHVDELEWSEEMPEATDCDATEKEFSEVCRDICQWIYEALRAEYEYQNSDEQIAESIRANEYEFTESGERA